MGRPGLLQVLDRAGVTTGGVVQLHLLTGAVWPSSGDEETWNYKHLSDNSQHEALQVTMMGQYLTGLTAMVGDKVTDI